MGITIDYEYLETCRKQSMLSNKAIAEASKVSESTVSKFFHAEMKDPSVHVLGAICDTIGASVDRACGIIKPIDEAMTDPSPSIPAVVADVVQTVSDIMDEKKVAEHVAEVIKDTPIASADPAEIARLVVEAMPKPQSMECESCRSARVYESSIAFYRQAIAALGALVLVLAVMLFFCK